MRRKYRKKIFNYLFILFICITLSSIPSIQEVGVLGAPTSPFSPSSSEFDTIDSFDVFPSNRWEMSDSGFGSEVSNGLLNLTDVGDGTTDIATLSRGLRSLDGSIEVRFLLNISQDSASFSDEFRIYLSGTDDRTDNYIFFHVTKLQNEGYTTTNAFLGIDAADSSNRFLSLSGNERVHDNTWYVLKFDYNIYESTLRSRLFFDNGSKVFDYDYSDLLDAYSGTFRIDFFRSTEMYISLVSSSNHNGAISTHLIDYVKAPFKERDWENTDVPSDPQWVQNNWNFHEIEDDVFDSSDWQITIPSLDSVAVVLESEIDSVANLANDEYIVFWYYVYAVDADDGDLHEAVKIVLIRQKIVGNIYIIVGIDLDGVNIFSESFATVTDPKLVFSVSLENDRSIITVGGQFFPDRKDTSSPDYYSFVGSALISDIATDPSQEFVLQTHVLADFDGDIVYKSILNSHSIVERGEFSGKGSPLIPDNNKGSGGLFGWLADIFIALIRSLGVFLAPFFLALGEIFEKIQGWLNSVAGVITTAIGHIAADIWTAMGSALDFITEAIGFIQGWIEGIITSFIAQAQDFIEAILLGLVALLSDVWDVIVGLIFLVWDFLTLPDLLAIAAVGIDGIVAILLGAPAFILDVINDWILPFAIIIICLYWLWLVFLSFAEERFEPLAGLSNSVDRLMAVYELTILGVGPLPIPIALFFIPLTYFMIIVPSGSVFAIW